MTITLGTPTDSAFSAATPPAGAMKWFPSTVATTPAGPACSTAVAAESGANDKDL